MTETRTIKINLTSIIEEMILALIEKQQEKLKGIQSEFERFYNNQSIEMKRKIMKYLLGHKGVIENKKLFIYFENFVV